MKALIVDDEPLACERLQRLLQRVRPGVECRLVASAEEANSELESFDADLVLLDVRMPGMGGVALAAQLAELERPPAVIFCTAYDEYALDALRHQAAAYLLKPVREEALQQALATSGRVNRAQVAALRAATTQGRSQVSSQGRRGLETLPVVEIRCFIADRKYVTACAAGRELLLPDALKDLEREFGERFLRVHRNALVALAHVRRLVRDDQGWCVELAGVSQRPQVSRRHLSAVKARLLGR
ncbi:MAG: LytR/AlgR family response regulator transcription factor [Parahaliea sp.]